MSNAFRIRTKDGYVSPVTKATNVHGIDMNNIVVPGPVGLAVIAGKLDYKDVIQCVVSGKNPEILLKNPDAVKPRKELQEAPDLNPADLLPPPVEEKGAPAVSELVLARAENRAPDVDKLTPEELAEHAKLVGVDPAGFSSLKGLAKAVRKRMETAGQ